MHNFWRLTSAVLSIFIIIQPVVAREQVRIVGSTAVYTFVTMVAERIGRMNDFSTPIVEATGSGGGIKVFCAGSGDAYPDIVDTSRQMTKEELKFCKKNGVGDILELKIGYDGIVVGMHPSRSDFKLTIDDLSKALSEYVIEEDKQIPNPYQKWNEINPTLPDIPIQVLGPTSSLATREVFEEKVILAGCREMSSKPETCKSSIREDGAFIEVAEYENVIVQKLNLKPDALGFVSYGFYHQNPNQIRPIPINGVEPTTQTISDQTYPLSRPLFVYVKKDQFRDIPGLKILLEELLSEQAAGDSGYLVDKGLIPLPPKERDEMRNLFKKSIQNSTG